MKKNRSDENTPDAKNQSEAFVVYCGGIRSVVIPEQTEDEVAESPEQF